jgi:hypothetical protein
MRENFDALYADFRQYYHVNLLDVLKFDGSLTVREAVILVEQLPFEARTVGMLQGGVEFRGWTVDRHLQASIVDALNSLNYMFLAVNTKKKPKPPVPLQRPGDAERKKQAKQNNPFALMVKSKMANPMIVDAEGGV